jgi:hypothetical protein
MPIPHKNQRDVNTTLVIGVCVDIEPAIQCIWPVFRPPVGRPRLIHYAKTNNTISISFRIQYIGFEIKIQRQNFMAH